MKTNIGEIPAGAFTGVLTDISQRIKDEMFAKSEDMARPRMNAIRKAMSARVLRGETGKRWNAVKGIKNAADDEVIAYGEVLDDFWAPFFDADEAIIPTHFRARLAETEGDVTIRMNSPGGDVFAGVAIAGMIDDIRREGRKVTVRVDGLAASAASFIAVRADEVVMDEMAQMMIHEPMVGFDVFALMYAKDLREMAEDAVKLADELDRTAGTLVDSYTARNRKKKKKEDIASLLAAETWMTATEAVDLGFADRVLEPPKPASEKNMAREPDTPETRVSIVRSVAMSAIRNKFMSHVSEVNHNG